MYITILISTLLFLKVNCISENASFVESRPNFIYNMYKYDVMYRVVVNRSTEQILDYYEDTDDWRGYPTRVHVSTNDTVNSDHPLFITATQQKGVSSWELPLIVQTSRSTMVFLSMARTLCPHDGGPNITYVNRPLIQIQTSSVQNVSVDIKLRRVQDFYVEDDKEVAVHSTPATPKYYYFSFDNNPWNLSSDALRNSYKFLPSFNYTIPKSIILIIESDDDLCAVVSIQNNSCPVFDNEREILYQGYHLTMTSKGGITLTQSMFPTGFYIVFIVKERDEECTGIKDTEQARGTEHVSYVEGLGADGRNKSFRFKVIATISYEEYLIAASVALSLIFTFFLLVILMSYCRCVWTEQVIVLVPDPLQAPSTSTAVDTTDAEIVPIMRSNSLSDSESAEEMDYGAPKPVTVAELCKSRPNARAKRSDRYFWSALTVAVVYALPVVQLLVTYQDMVLTTGNQDLCYYNFLCAHPFASLSDFNHVFSNCGYLLFGALFMLQVSQRQRQFKRQANQELGIPQHHGLFYSMGLALIMEGMLSACYHLCPNKMNFQFDSSFMYVIAVLGMVKLYQNRHPDVNARAHTTFLLLAFIMAIGLCGIMYPSVAFWVVFTILHLATCFFLTLNIYYFGKLKLGTQIVKQAWSGIKTHRQRALVPNYTARAVLLAIANVANWALAIYGLIEHNKDFARHLLAILMGNTILYTLFYIVMKLVHREKIYVYTWLYFVLAHMFWFTALKLFLDSKTKWSETPAQSRRHNAVCTALHMYDSHDLWHLSSAAALFLSFNLLLTVDDALANTSKYKIPVF